MWKGFPVPIACMSAAMPTVPAMPSAIARSRWLQRGAASRMSGTERAAIHSGRHCNATITSLFRLMRAILRAICNPEALMFDPKKLLGDLLGGTPGSGGGLREGAAKVQQMAKDNPLAAGALVAVLLGSK